MIFVSDREFISRQFRIALAFRRRHEIRAVLGLMESCEIVRALDPFVIVAHDSRSALNIEEEPWHGLLRRLAPCAINVQAVSRLRSGV